MQIYSSYQCNSKRCNKEFVLLTDDVEAVRGNGRYIVCPYCCSKNVKRTRITDSIKECMRTRSYKRVNGAIHQK